MNKRAGSRRCGCSRCCSRPTPAGTRRPYPSPSESFASLVFKTCGPINTTRNPNCCLPNCQNRGTHTPSESFFACFCAFLACFAPEMVHSCVSNMSSPSEIVSAAVLVCFQMTRPPLWDGLSLLMKPSQVREPHHTFLPCCCYVFA